MMSDIGTPSACERSFTETPEATVAGPVGMTGGWVDFSRTAPRSRS